MSARIGPRMFPFPLLTTRGFLLLLSAGIVPLSGLLIDFSLEQMARALTALLLAYVLLLGRDWLRVRRFLKGVVITPNLPAVMYSGLSGALRFEVHAKKVPFAGTLLLRPIVPLLLDLKPEMLEASLSRGTLLSTLSQTVTPLARGTMAIKEIYGRVTIHHGLTTWQFRLPFMPSVTTDVYPNPGVKEMRDARAFHRLGEGDMLTDMQGVSGREIDSLRQYSPGDDLRKVDWKRSARGRGLLVKVYRPETHQRLTIAIDCGRRMSNRIEDRLQIEYASDAAAQLLRIANENEDEIGLFAFSHKVLAQIPCRRGRKQEKVLADALTNLEVGNLEADYQLLTEWAHAVRRRSLMILITSISNPASFDAVRSALLPVRRVHLPIVFALADRDLQTLVTQKAANVTDAYMIGAGMAELSHIQSRATQLTRSGLECLYCDVAQLPRMLKHKYYELKRSGRL